LILGGFALSIKSAIKYLGVSLLFLGKLVLKGLEMERVFLVQLFLDNIFEKKGAALVENFVEVFLKVIVVLLLGDLD
jgi:hypothetical protein